MLKDAAPGTFVVRDSNSFPGAFGLALKVATPPPSAPSSPRDPSSELVRHFLIEPTSRGVRLKGCANEPVFSSLSALVYQHSLMAMALPCQLLLPEPEAAARALDSPGANSAQQWFVQGAGERSEYSTIKCRIFDTYSKGFRTFRSWRFETVLRERKKITKLYIRFILKSTRT